MDQALITGIGVAITYGWGPSANPFLRSFADRLPLGQAASGMVMDPRSQQVPRPPPEHSPTDPMNRLDEPSVGSSHGAPRPPPPACCHMQLRRFPGGRYGPDRRRRRHRDRGGAWSQTRGARVGSELDDGQYFEDSYRSISPPKAAALGWPPEGCCSVWPRANPC